MDFDSKIRELSLEDVKKKRGNMKNLFLSILNIGVVGLLVFLLSVFAGILTDLAVAGFNIGTGFIN